MKHWFNKHRNTIAKTIGGLNLVNGLVLIPQQPLTGFIFLLVGVLIVWDSYNND
jgi:hypothetical protein